MSDGERVAHPYDRMADRYALDNEENVINALYERPATIALLGDVSGRDVLEVGCGAGPLTAWLVDQGATVTAMDASARMLELAERRLGGRARLLKGYLEDPLDFQPDSSVDVVAAAMVLHYVRDWEPVLSEFHRVLRPGGHVVFSTHHPTFDWRLHSADDYFALRQVTETWNKGEIPSEVTFWRRPLTAMTAAIAAAGFVIEQIVEPGPDESLLALDEKFVAVLRTEPRFLFFRLRAAILDESE